MSFLVALNIAVFAYEAGIATDDARARFIDSFALVPFDLAHGIVLPPPSAPGALALVTSQFLHAGALHLVTNMLFLGFFGPRIEALCGHLRFVALYLACGVLGGIAQYAAGPESHVPSIGASGAIAGVLGAYVLRFPTSQILHFPAVFMIGIWAFIQFQSAFWPDPNALIPAAGGGIAYFAHIGGFLAGILLIGLFVKTQRPRQGPRVRSHHYH